MDGSRSGNLSWSPAQAASAFVCIFLLLLFSMPTLRVLTQVYIANPDYSYGFLVPLVAVALGWPRRHLVRAISVSREWMGLLPLLAGCLLTMLGYWYAVALRPGYLGHVFLRGIGLLLSIVGVSWTLFGRERTKALAPAFAFLLFAVPLPESLLLPVTSSLQHIVSTFSANLIRSLGTEVFREGNLLHLPCGILGVAEACSGIRSLMVLLAVAVACNLYMRIRWVRAILIVALAPVAAVTGNIFRVTTAALLSRAGHDEFLQGTSHEILGFAGVLLSGLILFAAAALLSKGSRAVAGPSISRSLHKKRPRKQTLVPTVFAGLILLTATGMTNRVRNHYQRLAKKQPVIVHTQRQLLADFPRRIGTFRCIRERQLSDTELETLQPSDYLIRWYSGSDEQILVCSILYWEPQKNTPQSFSKRSGPHLPEWCYPASGWDRDTAFDDTSKYEWLPDEVVYVRLFRKMGNAQVLLNWYDLGFNDRSPFSPANLTERFTLLIKSWRMPPESMRRRRYDVSIAAAVQTDPASAKRTAIEFARLIAPLLPDFGIRQDKPADKPAPLTRQAAKLVPRKAASRNLQLAEIGESPIARHP